MSVAVDSLGFEGLVTRAALSSATQHEMLWQIVGIAVSQH